MLEISKSAPSNLLQFALNHCAPLVAPLQLPLRKDRKTCDLLRSIEIHNPGLGPQNTPQILSQNQIQRAPNPQPSLHSPV